MLRFTCPSCGCQKLVRDERVSTPTRCRGCEKKFTLTLENCKPAPGSSNAQGRTVAPGPNTQTAHDDPMLTAGVEGALPGTTAGAVAGLLAGFVAAADGSTAVSWAMVGLVAGIALGLVLGGLAGMASRRMGRLNLWQNWPAPLLLGAVVGLLTGALFGGLRTMPWCGLAGLAAAGIWPWLARLTQEPQRQVLDPLAEGREDRSQAPGDDVRHCIDPSELDFAVHVYKRRRAQ